MAGVQTGGCAPTCFLLAPALAQGAGRPSETWWPGCHPQDRLTDNTVPGQAEKSILQSRHGVEQPGNLLSLSSPTIMFKLLPQKKKNVSGNDLFSQFRVKGFSSPLASGLYRSYPTACAITDETSGKYQTSGESFAF